MNVNKLFGDKLSFIKGARKIGPKNQYIISTGLPSLDAILGGGLSLGSLLLIEEDNTGTFSKIILKVFLSEGITCNHCSFVASQEIDSKYWLTHLPVLITDDETVSEQRADKLNIAWQYANTPKCDSAPINMNPCANKYNVMKYMESHKVKNSVIRFYDCEKADYDSLLRDIFHLLHNEKSGDLENGLFRLTLHSLGSVLWNGNLPLFLSQLRGLISNQFAACIVTIPTNLIKNDYIIERCEHICDAVIKFESLHDQNNTAYTDYNGLVHLLKLPAVNKWNFYKPETSNWGFKLKNKQLLIEKVHISPELGEAVSREEGDVSNEYLPE